LSASNGSAIKEEINTMRSMLVIAAIMTCLDQATKIAIRKAVPTRDTIEVIKGWFQITYAQNSGMAFGMLRGWNPIFIFFGIIAIVFIFMYHRQFKSSKWMGISLGLLLGGALGNLIDRVIFGHVTDFIRVRWWFIHLRWWPSFNVADACVCVGAAMVILGMFERGKSVEPMEQAEEANSPSSENP